MLPFWLGMSCLLLLISETGGRVYKGRKKPPALTAQRLRSGPHVCFSGMGAGCCPGWTVSPGTGQCLQPLCSFGCASGFCIAPNVCSCRDGHQGVTCADEFSSEHEKTLEDKGTPLTCLSALCDQNCRLVNGVPSCSCFHGYSLGKDGRTCYDVDECSRPQASSLCQQQCKNSIGSYRCLCFYGYQISPNGRSCIPTKNLNFIAGIAAPSPCGEYGCELMCNDGGCEHVSRVCPVGFRMAETVNGVTCTDIDECEASSCEGTCINTEGGFVCDCGPGMKLSTDRTSCYDIDECSSKRSLCQQKCKNLQGSYRCLCATGFVLQSNGHTCADINECRRPGTSHLCKHFCHNTHGSFFCSCRAGFLLDPDKVSCIEIPAGMQTTGLPWETQAAHGNWMPFQPTSVMPQTSESLTTGGPHPLRTSTELAQGIFSTTTTSAPQSTLANTNIIPRPQHLRIGHPPLAQKASGISHMPLKENMIAQSGTTTVSFTNVPDSHCWHNKELHLSGSTWAALGCTDCTCQDGNISCEKRICTPNCSHPVMYPDSCCPMCDGCLFEGVSRVDGELFPNSPDNCTICICLAGNVTCIPPVCPPVTCTDPFLSDCCLRCPDGCEFQDHFYPHGSKFSRDDNGCTSCLCQNGAVECSFIPCPSLECPRENWVLEAGQCCFKCQEPMQRTGCPFDDNGIEIPVGQIWSPGDPCAICICQADSSIVCKKTDCVETCPHPITVPGQCCPDCSAGCSYGRRTFRNNESFPSNSDPCLTCICLMGTVACSPIECAVNCTYPFHDEGECCPVCRDCTYDGRKVLNEQTFYLESDPCTQCTCQLGEVHCEAIVCSASCSHPYVFPGECCSSCEECLFEGHLLENGGSYILKVDPCIVCHCSGGNVQCEQRDNSCTPCVQKTQDCLNEVPDIFHYNQLQIMPADLHQSAGSHSPNIALKLLNDAVISQPTYIPFFQRLVSRRNTEILGTISAGPTTVLHGKTPADSTPPGYNKDYLTTNPVDPLPNAHTTITHTGEIKSVSASEPFRNIIMPSSKLPQREATSSNSSPQPEEYLHESFLGLHTQKLSTPTSSLGIPNKSFPSAVISTSTLMPQMFPFSDMSSGPSKLTSDSAALHPPAWNADSSVQSPAHDFISSFTHTPDSHSLFTHSQRPLSSGTSDISSIHADTTQFSLLAKNTLGYTSAPAPHAAHFPTSANIIPSDSGIPLMQLNHRESESDELGNGHAIGCSLKGLEFSSGSIFVADMDYCLPCECLNGEIYCSHQDLFPSGLCCQSCSHQGVDSCAGKINQVHSESMRSQNLCNCRNLSLHCDSCSFREECRRNGSTQTAKEEQLPENIHWAPLIFEGDVEPQR
ncbi:von Willebrand factor C and EGF domain-containing protein isoform X2 [Xenopus tropicalis]|uniref:von Willebrand factor C and EGF domain-containing protein isoform X2 n=1 Tax=Xenopus tropicalis TaxID=8364 RepID=A0A8J0ST74_XENTR|nr:von Willebrand factor C and EGF domain-containing protein isoform X2 [Xenopus tropicalis]